MESLSQGLGYRGLATGRWACDEPDPAFLFMLRDPTILVAGIAFRNGSRAIVVLV